MDSVEREISGGGTALRIFDEVLASEAVPDLESIPYCESSLKFFLSIICIC
jgi:hypothetical protein